MTSRIGHAAAVEALRGVGKFLLMTAGMLANEASASAPEIWVITDRAHPIQTAPGVRVIELDAPARIKAELSSQLPANPAQAARVAQQRLKLGGAELQERARIAHQGVIDAWSLGISKVPAIIVDRRYVIYGETDVGRAVARIEKHRRRSDP